MEIIRFLPLPAFLVFVGIVFISAIKVKQKGNKVSNRNKKAITIIYTVFLLMFLVLFVSELVFQSLNIYTSVLPKLLTHKILNFEVLSYLGAIVVTFSILLLHYTLKSFKTSLRFGLNSQNLGKLISSGIFAYSRNPFFLSILLLFIGIALIIPSIFFVAIAVLSLISIHLFILKEERFMQINYGGEYEAYCQKVRRYF